MRRRLLVGEYMRDFFLKCLKQFGFVAIWLYLSSGLFGIEVVPVEPTPEKGDVTLKLIFPRPYENKRKTPVNVQLRVQGFILGMTSPFSRASEIYNRKEGQCLHVVIDNRPYFSYSQAVGKGTGSSDRLLSFGIPFTLESGLHVIRVFPVLSYGESLKRKGCFKSEIFYFQDHRRLDTVPFDLFKPYITYNEPQGQYPASRSDPLLLDFYLSNCTLSENGYSVRLSIDGKRFSSLTKWVPYYIKGLKSGHHTIKLELVDGKQKVVPGSFNVVERKIFIEPLPSSKSS